MVVLLLLFFGPVLQAAASSSSTAAALKRLAEVEKQVQSNNVVEDLGSISSEILSATGGGLVAARLELVFAKQVRLLREQAIDKLRLATTQDDFETQCNIEADFLSSVRRSKPTGASWDFSIESTSLSDAARLLIQEKKNAADLQLKAAKQQADYMRIFQTFASQIQQLQASQFSRGLPMQAGFAYRLKDNINLSGSYQQGKARLELQNLDDSSVVIGDPPYIFAPSRGNFGLTFNAN